MVSEQAGAGEGGPGLLPARVLSFTGIWGKMCWKDALQSNGT